jgi:hypothetical protein
LRRRKTPRDEQTRKSRGAHCLRTNDFLTFKTPFEE